MNEKWLLGDLVDEAESTMVVSMVAGLTDDNIIFIHIEYSYLATANDAQFEEIDAECRNMINRK